MVDGVVVNEKCKSLARKVREVIDTKSSYADWLNNQRVRNELSQEIKICLVLNGYPPQYTPEVFRGVMEQVENFKENESFDTINALVVNNVTINEEIHYHPGSVHVDNSTNISLNPQN